MADSDEWRLVTTIATEMVKESGFTPIPLAPDVIAMLSRPQLVVLVPATTLDPVAVKSDLARWKTRMSAKEVPGIRRAHLIYCLAQSEPEGKAAIAGLRDVSFLGMGATCDVVDTSGSSKVSAALDSATRSSIGRGLRRFRQGTAASAWELEQESERHRSAYRALKARLAETRPWVTYLLLSLCLAMYAWASLLGGSEDLLVQLRLGGNYAPLTIGQDQWWRLVGSTFLHFGALHLCVNLLALWLFGRQLEKIYGNAAFLALYAVSGVNGALCSALKGDLVSVGASGALFGLFGAVVVVSRRYQAEWPAAVRRRLGAGMLPMLGFNLLYGFSNEGIDNAAHLGGLAAGLIFAWSLRPRVLAPPAPRRALQLALGGLGVAYLLVQTLAVEHGLRVRTLADYPARLYRDPWSSVSVRLPALFEPGNFEGQAILRGPALVFALAEMEEPDLVVIDNPWFQARLAEEKGHRRLTTRKFGGRTWLLRESKLQELLLQGFAYVGETPLRLEVVYPESRPEVGPRLLEMAIESLEIRGLDRRKAASRLLEQGLYARALEELEGQGDTDELQLQRARCYANLYDSEKAGAILRGLLDKSPGNKDYLSLECYRLELAGQPAAALEVWDKRAALATSEQERRRVRLKRASLLLALGRLDEAARIFRELIALGEPGLSADAYNNWSWGYARRGDYTRALPLAEKSMKLSAGPANGDTLATALYGLGRYDEAWARVNQVITADRNADNTNYYAAQLLLRRGERAKAGLFFERYLALTGGRGPHAESARQALRELARQP